MLTAIKFGSSCVNVPVFLTLKSNQLEANYLFIQILMISTNVCMYVCMYVLSLMYSSANGKLNSSNRIIVYNSVTIL